MRAFWSDRPNCSQNVSQKVKRIRRFSDLTRWHPLCLSRGNTAAKTCPVIVFSIAPLIVAEKVGSLQDDNRTSDNQISEISQA